MAATPALLMLVAIGLERIETALNDEVSRPHPEANPQFRMTRQPDRV